MILNMGHAGKWLWSTAASSGVQTWLMVTGSLVACVQCTGTQIITLSRHPESYYVGKQSKIFYTVGVDLFRNGWLMDIREA